jgi:hypothetical protein
MTVFPVLQPSFIERHCDVIVSVSNHTYIPVPHVHRPSTGTYLTSSSYSLPTQPSVLPALPTTIKLPASHSPDTNAATPLTPYHRLFLLSWPSTPAIPTWLGASFNHLAQPHIKCHTPTPIRAVKPVKEVKGQRAKAWLIYDRFTSALSPCRYRGINRVVSVWNPSSGMRAYPSALVPLSAGQGICLRSRWVSAP